jgi:hypothetical protein
MIGLDYYTPSKILSYMGVPCLAVAGFMGVIASSLPSLHSARASIWARFLFV